MTHKVGFMGYGNMAQAISSGLNQTGVSPYEQQIASDCDLEKLKILAQQRPINLATDNADLLKRAEIIIVCVKPAQIVPLLKQLNGEIKGQLFISIAAGITLDELTCALPPQTPIVRTMPNIAALSASGVTLMCAPENQAPEYMQTALNLFEAVGITLSLDEKLFDAGTAISGSGPAYFFMIMEALSAGAVRLGLSHETANTLVIHTALGAATMADHNRQFNFSALQNMVTSPGGTTAEGLFVMESCGLRGTLQKTVEAVALKSAQMGAKKKS
ncbi:MAG: pyrroline-5-carboxylate reductase [Candidatus Adiutrix sp.]